jgi:hypothetical protein
VGENTCDKELFDHVLKHLDDVSENIKHPEKSINEKVTNDFSEGLVTMESTETNRAKSLRTTMMINTISRIRVGDDEL